MFQKEIQEFRKAPKRKAKKKKNEDTIVDDDDVQTKADRKTSMSKEPTGKQKKSRSNEKGSVRGGRTKPSAEKTEKEKDEKKVEPAQQIAAALALCNYVINISEFSRWNRWKISWGIVKTKK